MEHAFSCIVSFKSAASSHKSALKQSGTPCSPCGFHMHSCRLDCAPIRLQMNTVEFLGIVLGCSLHPSGFYFWAILVSWGGRSGNYPPKRTEGVRMMWFQVWKVIAVLGCDNSLPPGSTREVLKCWCCPFWALPDSYSTIARLNTISKTLPRGIGSNISSWWKFALWSVVEGQMNPFTCSPVSGPTGSVSAHNIAVSTWMSHKWAGVFSHSLKRVSVSEG